jgi:flavin reductase (DIM6/NTAB) family NADH-FMN oxidoreductase RutF
MSLEKAQIPSERPIYPTPAGLVTTLDGEGSPNIIALGEIYNLSIRKPVIVGLGIAPKRYSHWLLCECREFVVNLPASAILDKVPACGE